MTKVSICVPNYNYGEYIGECIRSILNQTYKDFELIIVDDASTDNSIEIIESFSDSRIRVYENDENLGITKNWNQCLKYATGDYIAIFHSDDIYHSEIIEQEVKVLSHFKNIHLVSTKATTNIQRLKDKNEYKYILYTPFEFMKFLFGGHTLVCPSVMVRQECYEDIGRYNEDLIFLEDQEFYLRAALKYGLAKIDNVLMFYRQQEKKSFATSFEGDTNKHKIRILEMKFLKSVANDVCDVYKEEIKDYYLNFIATLDMYLSIRYKMISENDKAEFCFNSAKRIQGGIKRGIPQPIPDTI